MLALLFIVEKDDKLKHCARNLWAGKQVNEHSLSVCALFVGAADNGFAFIHAGILLQVLPLSPD
jgi:hypothetical protein